MRRIHPTVIGFFLLPLLAGTAWAPPDLADRYTDTMRGLSLEPPAGWRGVPGRLSGQPLKTVFFDPTQCDPENPGADVKLWIMVFGEEGSATDEEPAHPDFQSWFTSKFGGRANLLSREEIRTADGTAGVRLWNGHGAVCSQANLFERDGMKVALLFICPAPLRSRYETIFDAAAATFAFTEAEGFPKLEEGEDPEDWRARATARMAEDVPGWQVRRTGNYLILTDIADEAMLTGIERGFARIREVYEREFPPNGPVDAPFLVRAFADKQSYIIYYTRGRGRSGYWWHEQKELNFFVRPDERTGRPSLEETLITVHHEAYHQYTYYAFGELYPAPWFGEGYGDYFSGARLAADGESLEIGTFDWRLPALKNFIPRRQHIPLTDLVRMPKERFDNNPQAYCTAWGLVYFLRQGVAEDHPWSRILPTYFESFAETGDLEQSRAAAFDGVDMAELERAWQAFILELE